MKPYRLISLLESSPPPSTPQRSCTRETVAFSKQPFGSDEHTEKQVQQEQKSLVTKEKPLGINHYLSSGGEGWSEDFERITWFSVIEGDSRKFAANGILRSPIRVSGIFYCDTTKILGTPSLGDTQTESA